MDAVAGAFVDMLLHKEDLPHLMNIVHPHPVLWRGILDAINYHLDARLPFISYRQWLNKLQALASVASVNDLERMVSVGDWQESLVPDEYS